MIDVCNMNHEMTSSVSADLKASNDDNEVQHLSCSTHSNYVQNPKRQTSILNRDEELRVPQAQ